VAPKQQQVSLARTVEVLRERRARLARSAERVRRAPAEHDFVEVVDAAIAVDAAVEAVEQARSRQAGRPEARGS
jgi:hypothetical protein